MAHQPSSGKPYGDPGNPDDLYFSVGGDTPEQVQRRSAASSDGTEPDEGDTALGELGAGIKKRTRSSSLANEGQRVPISLEPDALAKSIHNRPEGKGGNPNVYDE